MAPGASRKGQKGPIHLPEWNENNALAQPNRVEIKVTNIINGKVNIFRSLSVAALAINGTRQGLKIALQNGNLYKGLYLFD